MTCPVKNQEVLDVLHMLDNLRSSMDDCGSYKFGDYHDPLLAMSGAIYQQAGGLRDLLFDFERMYEARENKKVHCGENCQSFVQHPEWEYQATCTDLNKTVCKNDRCKKYDDNGEPAKDITGEPLKRPLLF